MIYTVSFLKEKINPSDSNDMSYTKAYCPASLSFIFKVCPHKDLLKTGSVGIGCTINKGVTAEIKKNVCCLKITFNGKEVNFPPVSYAILKLTRKPVQADITSPLPLGYGFGISAASTNACLFALNKKLSLKRANNELVKLAHISEIINHTGLGSVETQITGGFLRKNSPGIPVDYIRLPFEGKTVYAIIIDKLETPKILKSKKSLEYINQAADLALKKIKETKPASLEQILDISFEFARKSGLLKGKKMIRIIQEIKSAGGHATMAMIGKVVLSDIKPDFDSHYRIEKLTITNDKLLSE